MPNLSIKDVPEPWAEALRQRAARNHRSLQGELLAMVEQFVHAAPSTGVAVAAKPDSPPRLSIEDIFRRNRLRHSLPDTRGPQSVDIIRHDRDTR